MTAYYEVTNGQGTRIMSVEDVKNSHHAEVIRRRIEAVHADKAKLVSLQGHALQYTAHEVENERNLLGSIRRYSTGSRTVTIPE